MYEDIPETDINKLYDEFINHSYEINLVQHFESINRSCNNDNIDIDVGCDGYTALLGYIQLIKCYKVLFGNNCIKLKDITYHLEEILKSAFYITLFDNTYNNFKSWCYKARKDDFRHFFENIYNENTYLEKLCDDGSDLFLKEQISSMLIYIQRLEMNKKMNDLLFRGETYIPCITSDKDDNILHYNIMKYYRDNNEGIHYGILYNASTKVEYTHYLIAKLNGINDYDELVKINCTMENGVAYSTGLHHIISGSIYDAMKQKMFYKLANEEVILSDPKPANKKAVRGTRYGNCATQTVREVLRDNLPDQMFRELYDFITLVPYSSKLEMLERVIGKSSNIEYCTEFPILEPLTADEVKEKFRCVFQRKVNDILEIEPTTLIDNLELIKVDNLNTNIALALCSEGREFLAESKARYLINAGVIKPNSKKSQAMVDKDLSYWLRVSHFIEEYSFYTMGYNLIAKKCLLMDVLINESLLDTTPKDGNNKSNTKTNWDSINAEDKKYIVQKLFSSTMKDSDFYLTKEILLVIKEVLLQSVEHTLKDDFLDNSPLPLDIKDEIVNSCRKSCLQNHKIDLPVRAQIAGDNYSSKNALKNLKLDIETEIIPKGHVAKIKHELELELRQKY
ncbi:Uncharacterised protein [Orientia tsutsugamushi str. Gilliam]|uniref:Uncharacterized protein n=1 Tax=Orientia tsutsugamushi str. Gilliam TaxID=1359184 RepID=A0A2U3RHB5_ORITS|nr:hypothetical protein [Orientia tsutsugamushi]SPR12626.1 Uncharacterised protein [Orientia tsutsugamushi str. Gilliam]